MSAVPKGTATCGTCVHFSGASGCKRRMADVGIDPVHGLVVTKGWRVAQEERVSDGLPFFRKCGPKGRFHKPWP